MDGNTQRVGRYELIGEIGRGGMGVVYLAKQDQPTRQVAVKMLHAADQRLAQRLQREADVLGQLQHPHIAPIIECSNDRGRPYVVMPYFSGGTLSDALRSLGQLPAPMVVGALSAIFDALGSLHEAGLVHRDVKPSNVLLSGSGEVFLADFGLVVDEDGSRLTSTDQVLGTAGYLAPEIVGGDHASPSSDVYAAGVMAYQLLAGQLPYRANNIVALIDTVRRGEFTPLHEVAPDTPDALATLVHACLDPNPARRPAARTASRQLRQLESQPLTPSPPSITPLQDLVTVQPGRSSGLGESSESSSSSQVLVGSGALRKSARRALIGAGAAMAAVAAVAVWAVAHRSSSEPSREKVQVAIGANDSAVADRLKRSDASTAIATADTRSFQAPSGSQGITTLTRTGTSQIASTSISQTPSAPIASPTPTAPAPVAPAPVVVAAPLGASSVPAGRLPVSSLNRLPTSTGRQIASTTTVQLGRASTVKQAATSRAVVQTAGDASQGSTASAKATEQGGTAASTRSAGQVESVPATVATGGSASSETVTVVPATFPTPVAPVTTAAPITAGTTQAPTTVESTTAPSTVALAPPLPNFVGGSRDSAYAWLSANGLSGSCCYLRRNSNSAIADFTVLDQQYAPGTRLALGTSVKIVSKDEAYCQTHAAECVH